MTQAISHSGYHTARFSPEIGSPHRNLRRFRHLAASSTARNAQRDFQPVAGAYRANVGPETRESALIFPLTKPQAEGTNIEHVRDTLFTWTRDFLARPHRDLGVPDRPVCPFVPLALKKNSLWLQVVEGETVSPERVEGVLAALRRQFPSLAPCGGREAQFKAAILAFPDMHPGAAAGLIDQVQRRAKGDFVEEGLMIGEFHSLNATPGLHNPAFFPLRAPVASLAVRFMVESDLPFLVEDKYSLAERERFLKAFLRQPFNHGVDRARRELAAIDKALAAHGASQRAAGPGDPVQQVEGEGQ